MTKPVEKEAKITGTEIVSIQDRIKQRLARVNETTAEATGNNISLKGSMFRLPSGATSQGPLECIIIDYGNQNAYYPNAYVEGEFSPPSCSAIGRIPSEMAPKASVEKPESAKCEGCPHNEWGSKGRGKACSNSILLAILPSDFTSESDVLAVKVAAKGLTRWSNYVRELEMSGQDPANVITELSFMPGLSYPSLVFKNIGPSGRMDDIGPFLSQSDLLLS